MAGTDTSWTDAAFPGTERFHVEAKLGAGGMGVVYQAYDRERRTTVALKALRRPDATSVYHFKREFRSLADLAHQNLVRLGELFCVDRQWFFTMELLHGKGFLSYVRDLYANPADEVTPTADTLQIGAEMADLRVPSTGSCLRFDESRLRHALAQLAQGVSALHTAHKVHRDIKPSNVIITQEGRLVLLDFGLVADLATPAVETQGVMGTVTYMAPEQAAGRPVGPAADWYSVGVVLFEALTGRPPYGGTTLEVMTQKQQTEVPQPAGQGIPEDLGELCAALLRIDFDARPTGREVLRRLGARDAFDVSPSSATASKNSQEQTFVGRGQELHLLMQAFADSARHPVTVFVRGESGLGKSALVRHFLEDLADDEKGVLVLAGACYERESLPYKAFDGIMDALVHKLMRLLPEDAALLLPKDVAVLARLFPVLRRIEVVERIEVPRVLDPQEQRRRAFAALREILLRLASRQPVVLSIDDFQWTDTDSVTLIADLFHPPEAPEVLLLATVQTDAEKHAIDPVVQVAAHLGDVRDIHLSCLSPEDSQTLLSSHFHGAALRPALVASIAREGAGHPLFLQELARHLVSEGAAEASSVRLDEVLHARIARLEAPMCRLVETLAVAGVPLTQTCVGQAADLVPDELARALSLLRVLHLVRGAGIRSKDAVELYHNRIRLAVLARLPAEERRRRHGSLANALEATCEDPPALVRHLEAAGQHERAALHAVNAARHASLALAFDQAAKLYGIALALGTFPRAEERRLQIERAESLSNAGRNIEAAEMFRAACEGAREDDSLELERRAAEQLLRSGRIDEGMQLIRSVFARFHETIPTTRLGTLLSLGTARARLSLRGLAYRPRDASAVPAEDLARIDTYYSANIGLGVYNFLLGATFATRHLLHALDAGEPSRIAVALAHEAAFSAGRGGKARKKTARFGNDAAALAAKVGQPHAQGTALVSGAICALLEGRWRNAVELGDQADIIFREQCRGAVWEMANAQSILLAGLAYLGSLREVSRRVPRVLHEAEERGDVTGRTLLCTAEPNLSWLVRDDVQGARAAVDWVSTQYSPHADTVQRYAVPLARVRIELYTGRAAQAHAMMSELWPGLERSLLLHAQLLRTVMLNLRAISALTAASELPPGRRSSLLRVAEKDAGRIAKEGMPYADALATLLLAGVASGRGDLAAAVRCYDDASVKAHAAEMSLHAAAAHWCKGELLGGDEGQRLCARALAAFEAQTVRVPTRMARMLAPRMIG